MRISNFLLWQIAYTELWITPDFWPDFRRARDLYRAIRRFPAAGRGGSVACDHGHASARQLAARRASEAGLRC